MASITMSDLSPEQLAQHDGWLRALVRRLVDDGQADDVVQEVWGHAMDADLRDQKALPAWLARVARRVAGKSVRSKQRRQNHEQEAAKAAPTSEIDAAELVARVEGRQQVAQTVLDLAEPFRTVVLLRYFEDQTPEQIALRLNVPGATVRTRLHRAHKQLRQRFKRERGSEWRGQLAVLVAPMGTVEGAVQPPAPTAAAQPKALMLIVPAVVAALVWVLVQTMSPTKPPIVVPSDAAGVATADHASGSQDTNTSSNDRETAPTEDPTTTISRLPRTVRIAGQVVDYAGRALPELEIAFVKGWPKRGGPNPTDSQTVGNSDRDGHFDVQIPRSQGTLRVSSKFATLRSWQVQGDEAAAGIDDALIVATKLVQLSGFVVDADGKPAADRVVRIFINDTVGLPLVASGTYLELFDIKASTDAIGNFQLSNVPAFPLGDLRVGRSMANDAVLAIPTQDRHDLRLVLGTNKRKVQRPAKPTQPVPSERWFAITGTVVTMSGEPIEHAYARAAMSDTEVETKANGQFQLQGRAMPNRAAVMWVAAEGFAPMHLEVWPEQGEQPSLVTAQMTKIDDAGLAISGKVVNEHNLPVSGLVVSLANATPLDIGSFMPRYVERPNAHRLGPHARTNSHGRFRIPGVLDRAYHVRVFDEATGFAQTHGPLHTRQEWTVHINQPRARPQMRVHVVDSEGNGIQGAEVSMDVVLLHNESDSGYGTTSTTSFVNDTQKIIADHAGDCRFRDAPGGDMQLTVQKPGYLTEQVIHEGKINLLEVRLLRLLSFRVATHGLHNQWPHLKLFDEAGNKLEVKAAWRGAHYPSAHKFGIHRSHSVVAAFPETVRRAELHDMFSGEVLRSMTVVPNRNGITVLDFPE